MKSPLTLLILLFLGCETVVEVSPPEYDPEPVATSFFSPNSTWSVTMHRSLGATVKRDASHEYISDASVTILDGSNTVDILSYQGNGRYVSTTGGCLRMESRICLKWISQTKPVYKLFLRLLHQ